MGFGAKPQDVYRFIDKLRACHHAHIVFLGENMSNEKNDNKDPAPLSDTEHIGEPPEVIHPSPESSEPPEPEDVATKATEATEESATDETEMNATEQADQPVSEAVAEQTEGDGQEEQGEAETTAVVVATETAVTPMPETTKKPYKTTVVLIGLFLVGIFVFALIAYFSGMFNPIVGPPPPPNGQDTSPPRVIYTGEFTEVVPFAHDEVLYLGQGQFLLLNLTNDAVWAKYNWSIVDTTGNVIVPFDKFPPIDGSMRGSFLTHDGNFFFRQAVEEGDFVALDRSGEILATLSGHDWVTYISPTRFLVRLEEFLPREETGASTRHVRWGVLDENNEFVIPFGMYDEVREANRLGFFVRNGYYMSVVDFDGATLLQLPAHYRLWSISDTRFNLTNTRYPLARRGIIDLNGEILVPRGAYYLIHDRHDGTSFASAGGRWYFLDVDGTRLFSFGRQNRVNDFGNRFLATGPDGTSIFSNDGRQIFAPGAFSGLSPAHENYFIVSAGGGFGIIDDTGRFVLPYGQFDEIYHLFTIPADRNFVRRGRYWGVVDSHGNEIIPVVHLNQIRTMHIFGQFDVPTDPAFLVRGENDFAVIDLNGETMIPSGEFENIYGLHGGMAIVRYGGRVGVVEIEKTMYPSPNRRLLCQSP